MADCTAHVAEWISAQVDPDIAVRWLSYVPNPLVALPVIVLLLLGRTHTVLRLSASSLAGHRNPLTTEHLAPTAAGSPRTAH